MRPAPLLAVCLAVSALVSVPAQAGYCELSNGPGTFGVAEWTNTTNNADIGRGISGGEVFEVGDGDDYYMVGVFLIDTTTARTVATYFVSDFEGSTRIYAEVAGRVFVDERIPAGDVPVGSGNWACGYPRSDPRRHLSLRRHLCGRRRRDRPRRAERPYRGRHPILRRRFRRVREDGGLCGTPPHR